MSPQGNAFLVIRFKPAASELGGRATNQSRESITPVVCTISRTFAWCARRTTRWSS